MRWRRRNAYWAESIEWPWPGGYTITRNRVCPHGRVRYCLFFSGQVVSCFDNWDSTVACYHAHKQGRTDK